MTQLEVDGIVKKVILSYPLDLGDKKIKTKIKDLVSRSNPYRIFEYDNDSEFIKDMIKTYLDKSWITTYGTLMENIQRELSLGNKTTEAGFDIEYPNRNLIIGSKSGPNWANSDQRKSMSTNAKKIKESRNCDVFVVCAYGKSIQKYEHYTQIAGQKGWELLTSDNEMYKKVMIALKNNQLLIKDLKNKVFCNLENQVIDFWTSMFYVKNKFDEIKYLEFVSKSK